MSILTRGLQTNLPVMATSSLASITHMMLRRQRCQWKVAQFNPGPFEFQEHEKWVAQRIRVRTDDVLFALKELGKI